MKHMELLHDQSSIERGNELISLMQESFRANEFLQSSNEEYENYFNDTVTRLISSVVIQDLSKDDYSDIGANFVRAKLQQNVYDQVFEDKGSYHPELEEFLQNKFTLVEDFLHRNKYKPIAAASSPDHYPIESYRIFGKRHPYYAEGQISKDIDAGAGFIYITGSTPVIKNTKNLYRVRVLRRDVPQVILAIGE